MSEYETYLDVADRLTDKVVGICQRHQKETGKRMYLDEFQTVFKVCGYRVGELAFNAAYKTTYDQVFNENLVVPFSKGKIQI